MEESESQQSALTALASNSSDSSIPRNRITTKTTTITRIKGGQNNKGAQNCEACAFRSDWVISNPAKIQNSIQIATLPLRLVCLSKATEIVIETSRLCKICAASASRYATVSHVWGNCNNYALPGISWDVPLHTLEKLSTIINVVRSHGINWLWVDFLCIDQSSMIEKIEETKRMRHYYQSSDVTLVFLDPDGLPVSSHEEDLAALVANSPWITRAWTLQEGVLPRRILLGVSSKKIWLQSLLENMDTGYDAITEIAAMRTSIRSNASDILKSSLGRYSTKVEDKVFGIIGLFPFPVLTEIRYGRCLDDIIYDVMVSAVEAGDFSLLMGSKYKTSASWKPQKLLDSGLTWMRHGPPASITPNGLMCRAEVFSYTISNYQKTVVFSAREGSTVINAELLGFEGNVQPAGSILLFGIEIGENTAFVVNFSRDKRIGSMNWKCTRTIPLQYQWHRLL